MHPRGLHHLRKRALVSRGLEPFPSRTAWKRILDYVMYGVGFAGPLALTPQIARIYENKTASGVSLTTWVLLTCGNVLWVLYASAHKDRQLFFSSALFLIFDFVIVAGILLY